MPDFEPYPDETGANFAKRMKNKSKQGSISRAAGRFLQTQKKEKPITTQY